MEDFLGIYRHLGLFEAHHVVIRWPRDTCSSFVSGLNAWTVVVFCARGVSGSRRHDIARGDHTHSASVVTLRL